MSDHAITVRVNPWPGYTRKVVCTCGFNVVTIPQDVEMLRQEHMLRVRLEGRDGPRPRAADACSMAVPGMGCQSLPSPSKGERTSA